LLLRVAKLKSNYQGKPVQPNPSDYSARADAVVHPNDYYLTPIFVINFLKLHFLSNRCIVKPNLPLIIGNSFFGKGSQLYIGREK
jgi:hypothetical protein